MIFPQYNYQEFNDTNKKDWPKSDYNEMLKDAVEYCKNLPFENILEFEGKCEFPPSFHPYWDYSIVLNMSKEDFFSMWRWYRICKFGKEKFVLYQAPFILKRLEIWLRLHKPIKNKKMTLTKQTVYLPEKEENDYGYFFTPEQLNEYTQKVIKQTLETAAEKVDLIETDGDPDPKSITNTFEETFNKYKV